MSGVDIEPYDAAPPPPTPSRKPRASAAVTARGSYVVALILAIGICTALNLLTIAVLYDAIFSDAPGISENATQILTGWGGGVLGVIGAVVGYQAGHNAAQTEAASARIDAASGTTPGTTTIDP